MKIENTFIEGLKIIRLNLFADVRGNFIKTFNYEYFRENNLNYDIKETYFSVSKKNVIRGMHFQMPPFECSKVVFLNQGKMVDVILDLRKDLQTYGKYINLESSTENPMLICIPDGCAHGFLSLEDNTIVSYLQTSVYAKNYDCGIKYNSFGMNWGIDNPIISSRDNVFEDFVSFNSPFVR